MRHLIPLRHSLERLVVSGICCFTAATAAAQGAYTINNSIADAFLAAGSAANPVGSDLTSLNFGGAGTLAISPASSAKGEFTSVVKFNSSAAVSQFNSSFGVGQWQITSLTLKLASNFADQGEQPNNGIFNAINAGSFAIDWLSYDSWVEGTSGGMGSPGYPGNSTISHDFIPTLLGSIHDSLGTFSYTPPGDNIYVDYSLPLDFGLVTDAASGGDISLYFYAADDQVGYLFNARSFAQNHPQFEITAVAVPEPAITVLFSFVAFSAIFWRKSGR